MKVLLKKWHFFLQMLKNSCIFAAWNNKGQFELSIMKKCFYLLLGVIAMSSVACNKVDDSYYLQGAWARYDDQPSQIVNGTKSEYVVWVFYSAHFSQEFVKGKYENGVIYGLRDEARQSENATYDYTYKNNKLTYNKTEVTITMEDDTHFVVDGTVHWTKLKEVKTPVFDEAAQIDLTKYDAKGDSTCWLVYKKFKNRTETLYSWGNEYNIASDVKLALSTAQAQSTELSCYWDMVNAATKTACESLNNK